MRCSMLYGAKEYGNAENAPHYGVRIHRSGRGEVSVTFVLDEPARGRGVGGGQGAVQRVSISIPEKTAEALSHGLQLAMSRISDREIKFRIEE